MSDDAILNAVNQEFKKVYQEHTRMLESFHKVNHQHDEMMSSFTRVEKEHAAMNRELAEIKDLLKTILKRLDK